MKGIALILVLLLGILILCLKDVMPWDKRGFDKNRMHRNGTRYDNDGYDYDGYDVNGYNKYGYNAFGKNKKGQYDRLFDTHSQDAEGFYDPDRHPVAVTDHARERFRERLGIFDEKMMDTQAVAAYRFGKSKRKVRQSAAQLMEEIEERHRERDEKRKIVLIYRNYIYIFSCDNALVTVYENERIVL